MNKNLRRIIAFTLVFCCMSAAGPVKKLNFFVEKAYAFKYDDPLLSKLEVSGYEIEFDKETYSYSLRVDKDVDEVTVTAKPEDSNYEVTVNGDDADKDNKYKVKTDIKQGESTITIRVKDEKHDLKTTYDINVIRGSKSLGDDLDKDEVYLDNLKLSNGTIDFSSTITEYNVYVDDKTRFIDVTAKPMDKDNGYVEINDEEVDESNDYEQTVSLENGKNKIIIRVENDKKVKKYKLNVYKGVDAPQTEEKTEINEESTSEENNNTNSSNKDYKNKWVQFQGLWLYYDENGNLVKNQWINDSSTGKSYYFKENGVMATGWLYNSGVWYFLNEDGSKYTGWKFIMGVWYYMDGNGVMKTGWIEDENGKWYYLNENGAWIK